MIINIVKENYSGSKRWGNVKRQGSWFASIVTSLCEP